MNMLGWELLPSNLGEVVFSKGTFTVRMIVGDENIHVLHGNTEVLVCKSLEMAFQYCY